MYLKIATVSLFTFAWILGPQTGLFAQETAESTRARTIAESSSYLATANGEQVHAFLQAIDDSCDLASLAVVGETTEARKLHALVLSKEGQNPLPLQSDDPRLVILILGGIHSGECDSKEALLSLVRDLSEDKEKINRYLEHAVLVFLPNFNADGNERVGKLHRPGQEGPVQGMGTRENAAGLDLNRDFVKLDSAEVRSLVRAIDYWDVDALLDCHTTNGSLHQYDITYDIPHNPAANLAITRWLRNDLMPTVSNELKQVGLPTFYYGNFSADHTKWESFGHEPRYSTEYMGLRGKIGILVESYSYASYERRVVATQMFVDSCLRHLTQSHQQVQKFLDEGRRPPSLIPIQAKIVADGKNHTVGGFQWAETKSSEGDVAPVDGNHLQPELGPKPESKASKFPSPRDRKRKSEIVPKEYEVQLWNVGEPVLQTSAPKYYYVPFEASWAAARLRLHGIAMTELSMNDPHRSSSVAATQYRVQSVKELPEFQSHRLKKVEVAEEAIEWRGESGWLITTDQPLGMLAAYLLEPHADDSLAVWNFFDPALRKGEVYPVLKLNTLPTGSVQLPLKALTLLDKSPVDMSREKLTLEKLYRPQERVSYNSPPSPLPRWISDRNEYLVQYDNRWHAVDCQTGAMQPFDRPTRLADALSKLDAFKDQQAAPFRRSLQSFDDKFEFALIDHKNNLYLYHYNSDSVRQLTHDVKQDHKVSSLSPTGRHVAYVHDNNLWVVDCESTETRQLTQDGGGEILNGYLDWVYQEEVYGRGKFKAYWWSPDGKKIAYLRLDETPVPTFVIDNSLGFAQSLEKMRYPKSGQPNPFVTLHVVDVLTGDKVEVPLSDYAADDRLVVRVGWNPNQPQQVVYQVQNRIQSFLHLWSYDVAKKEQKKLLEESSDAWIDVIDEPRWLADGGFLWLSDSVGGRRHLFRYFPDGRKQPLTSGDWDVKEIAWVAKDGSKAILTGHRSAPVNTDVLSVDLSNGEITTLGESTGSHRISVASSGEYFFDAWSDMSHPPATWLCGVSQGRMRYVGGPRNDRLDYVQTRAPELFTIAARDGLLMQAILYKPSNWETRTKEGKLPVLIHVYGGPQAPTVENAWTHRNDLWHRFMAEQGIAVLFCDNRSALGRGNADTWKIYKNLGETELRDLEDAVGWLHSQEWVDKDRIGLWGWSYGGYFTAYAMTHSKLFRAGISGAPVTDWNNYDSIYTERYMSTPQKNPEGYKSSSVVEAAGNLHGQLLLIHGEIDDNVHIANTFQFAHALQKAGKQFELMVYPNNRHGITDPNQSEHQYRLMTDFFTRTLLEHSRAAPHGRP